MTKRPCRFVQLLLLNPQRIFNHNLAAADGNFDWGGPAGATNPNISLDEMGVSTSPPDQLVLADFIGVGVVSMGVIAKGGSNDCDDNGVPDDCEVPPPIDLGCSEFNRYEVLTPHDTITLLTKFHNPEQAQGFAIVAATSQSKAVGFDFLIGQTLILDGVNAIEYGVNAVDYRATVGHGLQTDVDGDTIYDLNGIEYERTAAEIQIPRCIGVTSPGVGGPSFDGELILLGLSGGTRFHTVANFLIYNDNEDPFSAQFGFDCWDRVPLLDIMSAFSQNFLASRGHDMKESLEGLETGWMRIFGDSASSSAFSIDDPAIYAVYIERLGASYGGSDLPFERGLQAGHILPRSLFGDNAERDGLDPAPNYSASLSRRHPASLLLFPEFDNRQGDLTIMTVTNTHPTQSTTAHFVYYGKYGNP